MSVMTFSRESRRVDLLLLAGALALLFAWEASGWDLDLARAYGDAGGFAWRERWLSRTVLHEGGRWLAGACVALLAWDAFRPSIEGPSRGDRRYWLAVVIACMAFVPLLKRFSSTSCPWDLAEFGGTVAYVPHWLPQLTDGGPGHCFPSGHAVAAFAFLGTYFLWRAHRPRLARGILGITLLLGIAFAWAQMARGAHFASHSLWSAWLCWAASAGADRFSPVTRVQRYRVGPAPHEARLPNTANEVGEG